LTTLRNSIKLIKLVTQRHKRKLSESSARMQSNKESNPYLIKERMWQMMLQEKHFLQEKKVWKGICLKRQLRS